MSNTNNQLAATIQALQNDLTFLSQELHNLVGDDSTVKEKKLVFMRKMVSINDLIGHILKFQKLNL